MELQVCPVCNENILTEQTDLNEVHYRHHTTKLTLEYSFCPCCGEIAAAEQVKRNQQRMLQWRMEIDRLYDEPREQKHI